MNIKLALLLLLVPCSLPLIGQSGFGGIRVGDPISKFPFPCDWGAPCAGVLESRYVRVDELDKIVAGITVVYEGTAFLTDEPIINSPITFAQAINAHSLQPGFKKPIFGYATNSADEVYGLVDEANMIVYTELLSPSEKSVSCLAPSSLVSEVYYGSDHAPVLNAPVIAYSDSFVDAARTASPYVGESKSGGVRSLKVFDRKEAVEGLENRVDKIIGQSTVVLSLMDEVSAWIQVDKDNPKYADKSKDLQSKYKLLWRDYNSLNSYVEANISYFRDSDLEEMPTALKKQITRRLHQLQAMGFENSDPDLEECIRCTPSEE